MNRLAKLIKDRIGSASLPFVQSYFSDPLSTEWLLPMGRAHGAAIPELANLPVAAHYLRRRLNGLPIKLIKRSNGEVTAYQYSGLSEPGWIHPAATGPDNIKRVFGDIRRREGLSSLFLFRFLGISRKEEDHASASFLVVGSRAGEDTNKYRDLANDTQNILALQDEIALSWKKMQPRISSWLTTALEPDLLRKILELHGRPITITADSRELIGEIQSYISRILSPITDKKESTSVRISFYEFMGRANKTRSIHTAGEVRCNENLKHISPGWYAISDPITRYICETGRMYFRDHADLVSDSIEIDQPDLPVVEREILYSHKNSLESELGHLGTAHAPIVRLCDIDNIPLGAPVQSMVNTRRSWLRYTRSGSTRPGGDWRIGIPISACGQTFGAIEVFHDGQRATDSSIFSAMRAVADAVGVTILHHHRSRLFRSFNKTTGLVFRSGNRSNAQHHLNRFAESVRRATFTDAVAIATADPKDSLRGSLDLAKRRYYGGNYRLSGSTVSGSDSDLPSFRNNGWTNLLWTDPNPSTVGLVLNGADSPGFWLILQAGELVLKEIPKGKRNLLRMNQCELSQKSRMQVAFRLTPSNSGLRNERTDAVVWYSFIAPGGTYTDPCPETHSKSLVHLRHLYETAKICNAVSRIAESRDFLHTSFYSISRHEGMGQLLETVVGDISESLSTLEMTDTLRSRMASSRNGIEYIINKLEALRDVSAADSTRSLAASSDQWREPLNLSTTVDDCWVLAQRMQRRSLATMHNKVCSEIVVHTAPPFVRSILVNILLNSLKHARHRGRRSRLDFSDKVEVFVHAKKDEDGSCVITVEDTGRGFPQGMTSALKDLAFPSEMASGLGADRSGIGLMVVARLAIALARDRVDEIEIGNSNQYGGAKVKFIIAKGDS